MNIMVMDTDLKTILGVVDSFESFIWTDRYNTAGDFEIYLPASIEAVNLFQLERYVTFSESPHVMIIEKIEIKTDAEKGNRMTVSGRSVESLLERRIIWDQTILNGNVQTQIRKLIRANLTQCLDPRRVIAQLFLVENAIPYGPTIKAQFTGDNLYDAVNAICVSVGWGIVIELNYSYSRFDMYFYVGTDRSIDQSARSPIIFSPYFDNLIESNYVANSQGYKTAALVLGEGEGSDRTRYEIPGTATGINRRELYVDARDLSSTTSGGELTPEEYQSQLQQRGNEKLAECQMEYVFDGSINSNSGFRTGIDFRLGDIVTVQNEYGIYKNCRITEMIHSINDHENIVYPSFEDIGQ